MAALILLFSMAGTVTRRADAMREAVAEEHYHDGLAEEQAGHKQEAEARFRAALAVSRDHPPYRLALARVLLGQGRWQEAENHLKELAALDPTNGAVNLFLARARRAGSDWEGAVGDYQRAIYGYWPAEESSQRVIAREEMVKMLALRQSWRRLMPELMQWRDELPPSSPKLRQVADLFLQAGEPADSAAVWAKLRDANPKDASLQLGLAKAEFAAGNYLAAQAAYREALKLDRQVTAAKDGVELTGAILSLDPTQRRLSAKERLARAIRLVEVVTSEYESCESGPELEAAKQKLALIRRRGSRDQAADDWIQLAEQLWQRRAAACGGISAHNPALAYVLARLEKTA
ncbi:MAG: tetratricopeptide repeat protein [Bryobacteraceae bacterium]